MADPANCIFCTDIIDSPSIVWRDETVAVVLDRDPIATGHVLICPIAHYPDFHDVPPPVMHRMLELARLYIEVFRQRYAPAGYSLMSNNGAFNDLGHFHLHVFPRNDENEFSWIYGAGSKHTTGVDISSILDEFRSKLKLER